MIAILDYDAGNIKSVEKALQYLGADVILTRDRDVILNADKAILPGVGSFGDAMHKIRHYGLEEVIREFVATGKPFLGICLGLQVLFDESEESPGVKGLGILKGKVKRIPGGLSCPVPQIGWNDLKIKEGAKLFKGLPPRPYVYFVHSFYLEALDRDIVAARTNYSVDIDASCESKNVFACQFHPEKSSEVGLQILKNFINL